MGYFELLAKEIGTPALCADGSVGMLAKYPSADSPTDRVGIEVPGESGLRWVVWQDLLTAGEALRQRDSPAEPIANLRDRGPEPAGLSRRLLSDLWNALQPKDVQSRPTRVTGQRKA